MRSGSVVALAASLIACSPDGSRKGVELIGGTAPPDMTVRWVGHLHQPRTTQSVFGIGLDQEAHASILYAELPADGGYALHLQRRNSDGTVCWDQRWGSTGLGVSGFAVTQPGDTFVALTGIGALDLGSAVVTLGWMQRSIVKVDSSGNVSWHVEGTGAATSLAVAADGGVLVGSSGEVARYLPDGTVAWTAPVDPPTDALVASDGAEGAYVIANDPPGPAAGTTLTHVVDGAAAWTTSFEHSIVRRISAALGGGIVGAGIPTSQYARYEGAPLPFLDGQTPFAFGIAPEGALGWATNAIPGTCPAGTAPPCDDEIFFTGERYGLGYSLFATSAQGDSLVEGIRWDAASQAWTSRLDVLKADGAGASAAPLGLDGFWNMVAAAYDGRNALLVFATENPVTVLDTVVAPYDGQSPVLVMLSPP